MSDLQPGVTPAEPTPEGVTPSPEPTDGRDALIEKLRKFEREAQPQLKELERLRAAQEKAKREALSEAERLKADLDAAQVVVAERDRLQAERDELAAALDRTAKARLKALPDELQRLAPEDSPTRLLAWLDEAEKAAKKLTAQPTSPGTPSGPRGTGAQALVQPNQADLLAQKRRQIGSL
jgi:DNA repair exonuclease SbcCD ATPase subunit